MSQKNVEIVRAALDAYARRDVVAMTALNDPDVEADWSESRGWFAGVYRGNDAVMRFYEDYFQAFEMFVIDVESYIPAGDSVVVPNVARQRGREGIELSARSTFVFKVRDRRITHIRLYQNTGEAFKAVGLAE
jgi:ketosteroid isomerase-like protein